jgi:hypothetical protein
VGTPFHYGPSPRCLSLHWPGQREIPGTPCLFRWGIEYAVPRYDLNRHLPSADLHWLGGQPYGRRRKKTCSPAALGREPPRHSRGAAGLQGVRAIFASFFVSFGSILLSGSGIWGYHTQFKTEMSKVPRNSRCHTKRSEKSARPFLSCVPPPVPPECTPEKHPC